MDFANIFQTWITVLTKPSEATFEAERQKPNANLTTAIIWIVIATVILAVLSALSTLIANFISGGATAMQSLIDQADLPPEVAAQLAAFTAVGAGSAVGAFCFTLVLAPIGFLIGSGIHFLIAKLLGGIGSFEEQTYLMATFVAPLMIVNGVIGLVPFLGGCISFLVFIYQLVLTYFAVKVVHRLGTGQAVVVAVGPALIFFICLLCIFIGTFALIFAAASTPR
ncbi:MAG TPA: YIP1 family protein [Anaerolineae bacterium]|nr:YIP1 family protein [Anaerolineae bacterium]HXV97834.1 YIP1 family protein [Anaerolineae bacterium]